MTADTEIAAALNDAPTPAPEGAIDTSSDDEMAAAFDRMTAEPDIAEGQPRGADGKFAKAEATGEGEGEGEPASTEDGDGAAEVEDAGSAADASTAAPAHLPQAVKAAWDKLPEDARKAMADYQGQLDRRFSELGRQMEQAKPIVDRLTQATQQFPQFQGMTPDRLAQGAVELAGVQAALESGNIDTRANMVLQIAQRYGVLPQLAAMASGQQPDQTITALQQQIASLQARLQQQPQISPDDIEAKVSHVMSMRDTEATIHSFAQTKPLWAEVEASLPQFVAIVREQQPNAPIQSVLEAAYDMAVYANPVTRTKVQELETARAATTSQPDTERMEKAKRAASINVKPTTTGKPRQLTEEEAMAAAYDRALAS